MTPAAVVEQAAARKLEAIAITDHDTLAGYPEAKAVAHENGIELILGVEFTSNFHGNETHILGYGFDPEDSTIKDLLKNHKVQRAARAHRILKQLAKNGMDLDMRELLAETAHGIIGRPHIARLLVDKGYVGNYREAFIRYLNDQQLSEISNHYPDFTEIISHIRNAGGAAVLAHPAPFYTNDEIEEMIEAGLDGLECWHPSHNYVRERRMTDLAAKHSLLRTGGSDYHGYGFRQDQRFGILTISMERVAEVKRLVEQRWRLAGKQI